MTADQIRAAAHDLVALLDTIAKYTPTPWDDRLTAVARSLIEIPALLDFVAALLGDSQVQTLRDDARSTRITALAQARAADLVPAYAVSGVTFAAWLSYLPLVVRLLLSILRQR